MRVAGEDVLRAIAGAEGQVVEALERLGRRPDREVVPDGVEPVRFEVLELQIDTADAVLAAVASAPLGREPLAESEAERLAFLPRADS